MAVLKKKLMADMEGLSAGMDFIEDALTKFRFRHKEIQEALLLSEESIVRLIENAPEGSTLHLSVKTHRHLATIKISVPGPELSALSGGLDINLENSDMDRESETAIRAMLLKSFENKMKYAHKGKYNFIMVTAGSPERVLAVEALSAFFLALVVGAVFLLLPPTFRLKVDSFLLQPVQTVFINLLRLSAAPAVFFSIITSVANYASFSDPGRVSVKVLIGYIATSIASVFVGLAVFRMIKPGLPGAMANFVEQSVQSAPVSDASSILMTLVNIVPTNIIDPFLTVNTLQLIFLALIFGLALGRTGGYSAPLRTAAEALGTLCSKVTGLINGVVPFVVFCSTISIMVNIGISSLVALDRMVITVLCGLAGMILLYLLVMLVIGRLNPLMFLRKYASTMLETFLLGSGVAALPKTIRCCKNSLGISPKVYSFSIPFGAMANMDGNCIYLTVAGLFLARMCGVELFSSEILPLVFTIIILSIGAPMASGTVLLCMSVLLDQMGVSLTAVSLILGVNAVVEMLLAMSNTLGDVAITLTVARTEKLLDTDAYYARPRAGRRKGK